MGESPAGGYTEWGAAKPALTPAGAFTRGQQTRTPALPGASALLGEQEQPATRDQVLRRLSLASAGSGPSDPPAEHFRPSSPHQGQAATRSPSGRALTRRSGPNARAYGSAAPGVANGHRLRRRLSRGGKPPPEAPARPGRRGPLRGLGVVRRRRRVGVQAVGWGLLSRPGPGPLGCPARSWLMSAPAGSAPVVCPGPPSPA
jgi:hypothetical protein